MKKILLFLSFLFIFYISFTFLFYEKKQIKYVFQEQEFCTYHINFEKNLITTKQLNNLFQYQNFQIVSITPYYSKVYEKKIKNQTFNFSDLSKNITLKKIENVYFDELLKLGLQKELAKYKINGIPIHSMEVYTTPYYLEMLKQQYPLIEYYEKK